MESTFRLTDEWAPVVSDICQRLEGVPLAVELAAGRLSLLGLRDVQSGLADVLQLLIGGPRTVPARQQTMLGTLDWSYGLLHEGEQAVFRRLGVFVGEPSLDAAEAICGSGDGTSAEVSVILGRLVDASLVQKSEQDGRARFRLLEPVRQYAHHHLSTLDELASTRQRHAQWFLRFGKQLEADTGVGGPRRQFATDQLEEAYPDFQAAMQWCVDAHQAEVGLGLASALIFYWQSRRHLTEGLHWLRQLLAIPAGPECSRSVALAQATVGRLLTFRGEHDQARTYYDAAVPLARRVGEPWVTWVALANSGTDAVMCGKYEIAARHLHEAHAVALAAGDRICEALSLNTLTYLACEQAEYEASLRWAEEGVRQSRQMGEAWGTAFSLIFLGYAAYGLGEFARARSALTESVQLLRRLDDGPGLLFALDAFGHVSAAEERRAEARARWLEGLDIAERMGAQDAIANMLEGLGSLLASKRRPEEALSFAAAAEEVRKTIGAPMSRMRRQLLDRWLAPLRASASDEVCQRACTVGRKMSLADALALARSARAPRGPENIVGAADGLSTRELQVVALLAQGSSNRQIGQQLVISPRTVQRHVENILAKLGCSSRTQIATWAVGAGLTTTPINS